MYKAIIFFLFIIIIIIYEKFRRPIVCKRKIHEYIQSLNGLVTDIKPLGVREETYIVDYKIGNERHRLTAKFNLFYQCKWY